MPVRHVIVDRDGVLNHEDPNGGYVLRPEDWVWIDGSVAALKDLRQAGFVVSVATNQSAVGRGLLERSVLDAIHLHIVRDAGVEAIFACPHAPDDGCACRKPAPGLLHQAIAWAGVPASETVFIGDAQRDVDAARAAGVRPIVVRTGKGARTEAASKDEVEVFDDLRAVVAALKRSAR